MLLLALLKLADAWVLPLLPAMDQPLQITITLLALVFALGYGQRMPAIVTQHGALRNQAQELVRAAETDPLTSIANRTGLARRAMALLSQPTTARHAVLMLDYFKPVNDRFGHDAGDAVLQRVAYRLQQMAGPHHMVARLGGDEFVLLLHGLHERNELATFAQAEIAEVARPIQVQDQIHQVGASVGIARFPEHGDDVSRPMRRADWALYRSKHEGRQTYAFFDDLPPNTTSFSTL